MRRLAAPLLALSLLAPAASAAPRFAQAPDAPSAGAPMNDTFMEAPDAPVHAPSQKLIMKALARRRTANLARFRAYRHAGSYPHNYQTGTTRNVWRDIDGHLCAAATMIDRSGQHDLVNDIANNQTYVRLGEVTSGPLLDWILTSGLTQVEVATIQEPMMAPRETPRQRDRSWQIAEDARLRKRYAQIERGLRENRGGALAQAADRLSENPALAWTLVNEELGIAN